MNLSLSSLINKIHHETASKSISGAVHRGRDWKFLILFLLIACLVGLGLDGYLFWKLKLSIHDSTNVSVTEQAKVLDSNALESVINTFETRAEQFQKFKTSKPAILDPAI